MMKNCPVCSLPNQDVQNDSSISHVSCLRCGEYKASRELMDDLPKEAASEPLAKTALSEYIRHSRRPPSSSPFKSSDIFVALRQYSKRPPTYQADQLLLYVADRASDSGTVVSVNPEAVLSEIRAIDLETVANIVKSLVSANLLINSSIYHMAASNQEQIEHFGCQLTFDGWKKVEELRFVARSSKIAFMAMKFGDAELDKIVDEHLRPTVRLTGYELEKVSDRPAAGLIDDRMRLLIRSSRFLLADLTHGNQGAYWEAGYAEGLGKPVIYLCKKSIFDNPTTRPHFDTNHHLTVAWDEKDIGASMEMLKATIRVSVPEAKQDD
jgi:hypothetical protein